MGGLGNQLFQYAAAKNLARLNKSGIIFNIDWYTQNFDTNNTTPRFFDLSFFKIKYKKRSKTCFRIINRLYKPLVYAEKNSFEFDPNFLTIRNPNIHLYGHWTSFDYFNEIKEDLQNEICPIIINDANKSIINQMTNKNSVSIHIRRGDYLKNNLYAHLDIDYYNRAIEIIKQDVDNPFFFVFSDDVSYAKKILNFEHCQIVDINNNKSSHMDLYLMSQCKHNIIANSTFSAWSAYLNRNPKKKVIAPKDWYNSEYLRKEIGYSGTIIKLIPNEWIKL